MSNSHDYIEAYFQNQLNDLERKQFEERCVEDQIFSREVALYITLREGVRQQLLDQKRQQWREEEHTGPGTLAPIKKMRFKKWAPYAAAASILLAVLLTVFNSNDKPGRMADEYISQHLTSLSQTMDASRDSLQQGIAAFNNRDYNKALQIFEDVYKYHPENINAKKYIGLVYLLTKDYDTALIHFRELSRKPGLYKNPGLFLEALTLMERNKEEDRLLAKQLLTRLVNQNGEGSREAKRWLEKW